MAELLGIAFPSISITSIFSSSWIWVLIVAIVGFILIATTGLIMWFRTFNRKVIIFENISGLGYQPVIRKRARVLKVGSGGEELLSLLGGTTMSAYGKKMGKNTYWFAKGGDGYYYNFLLGDLDTKMAILDIEPVDTDVRMFHVAKDKMNRANYQKKTFMEQYGTMIISVIFLIIFIVGMWIVLGKIGKLSEALTLTQQANAETLKITKEILQANANMGGFSSSTSGLVPA